MIQDFKQMKKDWSDMFLRTAIVTQIMAALWE